MTPLFPKQGLMVLVDCEAGCRPFWKKLTELFRKPRHFCSAKCYQANVDLKQLASAGGRAPHRFDRAKLIDRARKGGLRRTETQGTAGIRRIAMLGVAARMALPPTKRREHARKAAVRGALTRWGTKRYFGVNVAPPRRQKAQGGRNG